MAPTKFRGYGHTGSLIHMDLGSFLKKTIQEVHVPSDTKLFLTKNYSEIIIFAKITNFKRNSLKKSFFPGNLESAKSLENYEK